MIIDMYKQFSAAFCLSPYFKALYRGHQELFIFVCFSTESCNDMRRKFPIQPKSLELWVKTARETKSRKNLITILCCFVKFRLFMISKDKYKV